MEFDKARIKDYATTLALAAIPVIVTYQAEIGKHVPVEYALMFTIVIGILSQLTADKRVKAAVVKANEYLDTVQEETATATNEVEAYIKQIKELQEEIDKKQEEVNRVAGLKELAAA